MGRACSCGFLNATNKEDAMKEAWMEAYEFAECEGDPMEGSTDYHGNLKFFDKVFDNEDDAKDYLDNIDSYQDGVCLVKTPGKGTSTRYQKQVARIKAKKQKLFEDAKEHFIDRKSKSIGCKACGTRMSNEVALKNDLYCPYCYNLLLPESKQLKLKKIDEQLEFARKQYLKDIAETGKPRYWCKLSVHC